MSRLVAEMCAEGAMHQLLLINLGCAARDLQQEQQPGREVTSLGAGAAGLGGAMAGGAGAGAGGAGVGAGAEVAGGLPRQQRGKGQRQVPAYHKRLLSALGITWSNEIPALPRQYLTAAWGAAEAHTASASPRPAVAVSTAPGARVTAAADILEAAAALGAEGSDVSLHLVSSLRRARAKTAVLAVFTHWGTGGLAEGAAVLDAVCGPGTYAAIGSGADLPVLSNEVRVSCAREALRREVFESYPVGLTWPMVYGVVEVLLLAGDVALVHSSCTFLEGVYLARYAVDHIPGLLEEEEEEELSEEEGDRADGRTGCTAAAAGGKKSSSSSRRWWRWWW